MYCRHLVILALTSCVGAALLGCGAAKPIGDSGAQAGISGSSFVSGGNTGAGYSSTAGGATSTTESGLQPLALSHDYPFAIQYPFAIAVDSTDVYWVNKQDASVAKVPIRGALNRPRSSRL